MAVTAAVLTLALFGHPLGDRAFDRGIQVHVAPDTLWVDYDLRVTELTLVRDLLALLEPGQNAPANPKDAAQLYAQLVAPIIARGLLVVLNDDEANLVLDRVSVDRQDHVTVKMQFRTPIPKDSESYSFSLIDTNFPGERGFRRLAIRAENGVRLLEASAPEELSTVAFVPSWEMTPEQEEASGRLAARFAFGTSESSSPTEASEAPLPAEKQPADDDLRNLLATRSTNVVGWLTLLGGAFVFGMLHAIKPGHGKTMVAAYLVGEQGTLFHALLLGLMTTLTHTGSVLFVALLLGSLAGRPWVDQEAIRFWLTFVSGALIVALGATLLRRRLTGKEDLLHVHGEGGHVHLPDGRVVWSDGRQGADAGHTHSHGGGVSVGNLLTLGFSGGLVPCDDAVLLLLAAIGAGLMAKAIYILLAFSAGLASVLVLIGVLVVKVKGFANANSKFARLAPVLQVVSATLITLIGVGVCYRAFVP